VTGESGFESKQEHKTVLFSTASTPALVSNRLLIQEVPGVLSPGVKWPGWLEGYSPSSSAKVKNAWSYTSTDPHIFIAPSLTKHSSNFTFKTYFLSFVKINHFMWLFHFGNILLYF
jgi:hypothetical protein